MNEQLQQYYNYLKGAKADVPSTYESFEKTLSDENSARQYYQYLKDNKFDAPDSYESFANTLNIKKNGFSLESLEKGQNPFTDLGITSEPSSAPQQPSVS
jgi:hypothetical protein